MTNGKLYLPSAGGLAAAGADTLSILDAQGIAVLFEVLESDITFDGLTINANWLVLSQFASQEQAALVDQAISLNYPPTAMAGLRVEGIVRAADAVRWLRALKLRTSTGPTKHTRLALVKE